MLFVYFKTNNLPFCQTSISVNYCSLSEGSDKDQLTVNLFVLEEKVNIVLQTDIPKVGILGFISFNKKMLTLQFKDEVEVCYSELFTIDNNGDKSYSGFMCDT